MDALTPTQPKINRSPVTETVGVRPRFSGIGPESIKGFIVDTAGVWIPKQPFIRSKAQFAEEAFLEFGEDVNFYFAAPIAGQFISGPVFRWLGKHVGQKADIPLHALGTPLKQLAKAPSRALIGAKAGTMLFALALAGGLEYMIPFWKNLISADWFKAKNFTAIAGLEKARTQLHQGEHDPVEKAHRRLWQVASVVAGVAAASLLIPKLVASNGRAYQAAKGFLKAIDFNAVDLKAEKTPFDLSRTILAAIIGIGVASYLDASRESLERKETGSRLALVVPYLLFGKAWATNALASVFENWTVGHGANRFRIKDKVRFIDSSLFQKGSWLDFNKVKDSIKDEIKHLPQAEQKTIQRVFYWGVEKGSYALAAVVVGAGSCALVYHQTRVRFQKRQAEAARFTLQHPTPLAINPPVILAHHSGWNPQKEVVCANLNPFLFAAEQYNTTPWPNTNAYNARYN